MDDETSLKLLHDPSTFVSFPPSSCTRSKTVGGSMLAPTVLAGFEPEYEHDSVQMQSEHDHSSNIVGFADLSSSSSPSHAEPCDDDPLAILSGAVSPIRSDFSQPPVCNYTSPVDNSWNS